MLEQIESALLEFSTRNKDKRVHFCQVAVTHQSDGRYALGGKVLDSDTLLAVTADLETRFPTVRFDEDQVSVLQKQPPQLRTVCTNLTGLYAEPSFRSEMVSQVLNGWELELLEEQGLWAFIRQPDGYLGWVYRSYLAEMTHEEPTHIVNRPVGLVRKDPDPDTPLVGRIMSGTAVRVVADTGDWRQIASAGGATGWLPRTDLRPLNALPQDEIARRQQMVEDGLRLVGVPYLWGGCSALGIDCSGLAQLLHRLVGITLPRDADMQCDAGRPVDPPYQPGDLFFFGNDYGHRSISHVAISLGGWNIIHASRSRNGVYTEDLRASEWLWDHFLGARSFLD